MRKAVYRCLCPFSPQSTPPAICAWRSCTGRDARQSTGYDELDKRSAKTLAQKERLLTVLDFPHLPLHNNPAALAARQRVRKRDISFGPRTSDGVEAWDTFLNLTETAKKLGVNFYAYVHDRVSGAREGICLADLILQSPASGQQAPASP